MSNVEAMQKLYKAITGKETESVSSAEIISDLADYYDSKNAKATKKGASEAE